MAYLKVISLCYPEKRDKARGISVTEAAKTCKVTNRVPPDWKSKSVSAPASRVVPGFSGGRVHPNAAAKNPYRPTHSH